MAKKTQTPEASGKWVQRVPRSLHKNLQAMALEQGVSLNHLVNSLLSARLGRETPAPKKKAKKRARQSG